MAIVQKVTLPTEAITEYQELYRKRFGQEISFQDAEVQAYDLFHSLKAVYQPISNAWIKEFDNKRKSLNEMQKKK